MIRSTSYGSAVIEYTLTRSPRSSLSISVLPDGVVTVTAPEEADPDDVDERVRRRARWILRQQRRFAEFRPTTCGSAWKKDPVWSGPLGPDMIRRRL